MNATDKIAEIDARRENVELAERALPVLVGVLCHPDAAEQVREALDEWLALPKRGLNYRADAFTRTLWLALCDLLDAGRPIHPTTVDQQAAAVAGRRLKGLLDDWTPEHSQQLHEALTYHAPNMSSATEVAALARDWACEAAKLCDLGPKAARLSEALAAGEPVAIASELERLRSSASRCVPVGTIPSGNLDELFEEWEQDDTPDKIASRYADLDERSGGLDIGVTLIAGRSNDGKTAALLSLAMAQAFPNSAEYAHRKHPHKRIEPETDDGRPYVLFLSAEMPRKEMLSRIAASLLLIDNGALNREKARAVADSTATIAELREAIRTHGRITLLDSEMLGSVTPRAVCAAIEAWATAIRDRDPGAKLLACLDYLQFLDGDGDGERYEQVNAAMRMVLHASKSHRVATLVGVQCCDGPHPTQRSDIRASKGVIDDAKSVLVIQRHVDDPARFSLFNDKARAGERGWTVDLYFEGRYTLLTSASPDSPKTRPVAAASSPFAGKGIDL